MKREVPINAKGKRFPVKQSPPQESYRNISHSGIHHEHPAANNKTTIGSLEYTRSRRIEAL
jgi:hypothetical protein